MNDESEGIHIVEKAKEVLMEQPYEKEYVSFVLDSLHDKIKSKCFICSFSRDNDSLPLWQNYTKSNDKSGYNIAFKISDLRNALYKYFRDKEKDSYNAFIDTMAQLIKKYGDKILNVASTDTEKKNESRR